MRRQLAALLCAGMLIGLAECGSAQRASDASATSETSAEAGQYAVDNLKADYNANALAKAKEYQEQMKMSPSAIRDQLTSEAGEKFTALEADYAVQHLND